ncbi:quinolinate synthase NadA [candidate division WOR-3 bacterium]|nr:quinolinate synthase NadA [candidate division WOR-3 bacterium]
MTDEKSLSNEEMTAEIKCLTREKDAFILVHNYQLPEIQALADILGDSLDLARRSAETMHKIIVFCGVRFMAETAHILAPDKLVLHPRPDAGCPMADMVDVEGLRNLKAEHPRAKTVAYVNTNAEVKAEVDVCCTSSNAVKVVEGIDAAEIIFVPDCNLADYVQRFTKKKIIPWAGFCYVHRRFKVEEVEASRNQFPDALLMVHPECDPEVVALADVVASTNGMVKEAKTSKHKRFIVGTEEGLIHRLKQENPGKEFYSLGSPKICENMKKIRLEHVLDSLRMDQYKVTVEPDVAARAKKALNEMLRYV